MLCVQLSVVVLLPSLRGLKLQYLLEVELSSTEPEASVAMVAIAMAPSAAAAAALVYALI